MAVLKIFVGEKNNNQLKVIKNALSYVENAVNDGWSDYDASLLCVYINKHLSLSAVITSLHLFLIQKSFLYR